MALRKSNLPGEKIPPISPRIMNILLSCFFHVGGALSRRGFPPRAAALRGEKAFRSPPVPEQLSCPSDAPPTTLAPFLIPFPSLHTRVLLTNPQRTCGDLFGFTWNR